MFARRALALAVCAVAFALATPALAQSAVRGQRLAQERCARCHLIDHPTRGPLVGGQGVKSEARASPNPSAPPFVVIALSYRPADLEEALVEGVLVGHDDASKNPAMPEFSFPPAQARDLVAYLESLAR